MSKYGPYERASWHPGSDSPRPAAIREPNHGGSLAILSQLLIRADRKPVQAEMHAMRLLPKLFGFLLIPVLPQVRPFENRQSDSPLEHGAH